MLAAQSKEGFNIQQLQPQQIVAKAGSRKSHVTCRARNKPKESASTGIGGASGRLKLEQVLLEGSRVC
jgi:hypothetical protein